MVGWRALLDYIEAQELVLGISFQPTLLFRHNSGGQNAGDLIPQFGDGSPNLIQTDQLVIVFYVHALFVITCPDRKDAMQLVFESFQVHDTGGTGDIGDVKSRASQGMPSY
jgi:hypothetical protein